MLIHIITEKGHGYEPAVAASDKMHGVAKYDIITGKQNKPKGTVSWPSTPLLALPTPKFLGSPPLCALQNVLLTTSGQCLPLAWLPSWRSWCAILLCQKQQKSGTIIEMYLAGWQLRRFFQTTGGVQVPCHVQQKSGITVRCNLQAGSYTNYFADALIAEAEVDSRVVGIHAAMGGGTGMNRFEQRFPERTFDVGIAEQVSAGCHAHLLHTALFPRRPIQIVLSTRIARCCLVFTAALVGEQKQREALAGILGMQDSSDSLSGRTSGMALALGHSLTRWGQQRLQVPGEVSISSAVMMGRSSDMVVWLRSTQ